MKRIKILILSFLSLIFLMSLSFKAYAGDMFRFEWFNTNININIGESANNYKNVPRAILYKNNVALDSSSISYDTNGDWMYYFKNINTNVPGKYYVWYKAYDNVNMPGTCTNYKCLISFNVVDNVKPEVEVINDVINVKRGNTFDYKKNISYKDNYSKECVVNVLNEADFNTIGKYDILLSVSDEYNNVSKISYVINVYDDSKPTIYFNGAGDKLVVNVNSIVNINEYFEAFDPFDGDISKDIKYPYLDTSSIGQYEYTVSVTNSINYTKYYTVIIEVVDDVIPVMNLKMNDIILDYMVDLEEYPFYDNVLIEDNTPINYDNLRLFRIIIHS